MNYIDTWNCLNPFLTHSTRTAAHILDGISKSESARTFEHPAATCPAASCPYDFQDNLKMDLVSVFLHLSPVSRPHLCALTSTHLLGIAPTGTLSSSSRIFPPHPPSFEWQTLLEQRCQDNRSLQSLSQSTNQNLSAAVSPVHPKKGVRFVAGDLCAFFAVTSPSTTTCLLLLDNFRQWATHSTKAYPEPTVLVPAQRAFVLHSGMVNQSHASDAEKVTAPAGTLQVLMSVIGVSRFTRRVRDLASCQDPPPATGK